MDETRLVERRTLMDAAAVSETINGMAASIAEHARENPVGLVGIQTGGVYLAERICHRLEESGMDRPPQGVLDITLYRDDIFLGLQQPLVRRTDIPFEVSGRDVILVDDVLYTGRTVRAALDALVDFGRPRAVKLAVLVDRGLREYPIRADWVGLEVDTSPSETVQMELIEMDAPADRVAVYGRED